MQNAKILIRLQLDRSISHTLETPNTARASWLYTQAWLIICNQVTEKTAETVTAAAATFAGLQMQRINWFWLDNEEVGGTKHSAVSAEDNQNPECRDCDTSFQQNAAAEPSVLVTNSNFGTRSI